ESVSKIKLWDPPRCFVAESEEGPGPVATEWTVEARAGGTCVVRVVHRWFASTEDWDAQFEGHSQGWISFFRLLRLYLSHFRGLLGSQVQLSGFAPEPKDKAWADLTGKLGLTDAAVGKRVETNRDTISFAGVVERVGEEAYPEELLVRLDQPA